MLDVIGEAVTMGYTCKEVLVGGCFGEDSLILKSDSRQQEKERGAKIKERERELLSLPLGFSKNPFCKLEMRAFLEEKIFSGFGEKRQV